MSLTLRALALRRTYSGLSTGYGPTTLPPQAGHTPVVCDKRLEAGAGSKAGPPGENGACGEANHVVMSCPDQKGQDEHTFQRPQRLRRIRARRKCQKQQGKG